MRYSQPITVLPLSPRWIISKLFEVWGICAEVNVGQVPHTCPVYGINVTIRHVIFIYRFYQYPTSQWDNHILTTFLVDIYYIPISCWNDLYNVWRRIINVSTVYVFHYPISSTSIMVLSVSPRSYLSV